MIRKILLDLDDTLNSFTMTALGSVFNCPVGPLEYDKFPTHVGYDIMGAYEVLKPHGAPQYELAEFWDSIKRDFWAKMPRSNEFNMLLENASLAVGQTNICILTASTKDPDCLAGKLEWIHDNLPPWLWRNYLIGPRKHFCAHPESLLVDDSDEQVNSFRAHGGNAILVPRPWNSLHGFDTMDHLKAEFSRFTFSNAGP